MVDDSWGVTPPRGGLRVRTNDSWEERAAARAKGAEGMAFGPLEAPAAARLPGPAVHYELAKRLVPVLRQMI